MRHGYTKAWVSKHVAELVREGYPQTQAVRIAHEEARKAWRSRHPRGAYPAHLKAPPKGKRRTKRNPVPESIRSQVRKAAQLYEDFTGHDAEEIGKVSVPKMPKVAVAVGEVEAIMYNTVRDGVRERYIHKFKAKARPLFCVSPDGKQLLLVDGDYDFTERGIVDRT